jgi:uncharacterized protein (TIGR03437 family)
VGDFNGDGKADLAVTSPSRSVGLGNTGVSILLGNGDGTFRSAIYCAACVNWSILSIAVGDFNGDGKADLVLTQSFSVHGNPGGFTYYVDILLGNGDGTFKNAGSVYGSGAAVVGDFNGDGKADLAFTSPADSSDNTANRGGTVTIMLGNGDGTFQNPASLAVGTSPVAIVAGEFNGDGRTDLAVLADSSHVFVLLGAAAPTMNAGGVVTGANYSTQLASGQISTIFGTGFSFSSTFASAVPLPTVLDGVSVTVNGILAPLFFVGPGQINFQIPWEVLGQSPASVVTTVNGSASAARTVNLSALSPGIFTTNSSGSGQGAILIAGTTLFAAQAGSLNVLSRPVQRGEYLLIFCSGLGDVSPRPATGAASPGSPPSNTLLAPSVTIGGASALVSFAGLAPGLVGLYQVNVQVPAAAPSGNQVAVVMSINGTSSNTVTIAVQ